MAPNFCPHCGHRLYQHNGEGCEHVDIDHINGDPTDNRLENLRKTSCDCKVAHPFLRL